MKQKCQQVRTAPGGEVICDKRIEHEVDWSASEAREPVATIDSCPPGFSISGEILVLGLVKGHPKLMRSCRIQLSYLAVQLVGVCIRRPELSRREEVILDLFGPHKRPPLFRPSIRKD